MAGKMRRVVENSVGLAQISSTEEDETLIQFY